MGNENKQSKLVIPNVDAIYITREKLFAREGYRDLTETEQAEKAIEQGWRWDASRGKYYRLLGY